MSIDGLYIGQRRVRPSIQKIGRCGRKPVGAGYRAPCSHTVKLPPMPKQVIAEQKKEPVPFQAQWSFERHD